MKIDTQEHIKWLCILTSESAVQPHKKCKAYDYHNGVQHIFDCGYKTKVQCFECKYGHGRKDPKAIS